MTVDTTPRRSRGPIAWSVVGLLVALLVVATAGSASAAAQLDKVTVVVIPVDPAAQVMYAKDRGFFRKQGIDAELKIVADGTQTVPALLSGQAQFAGVPVGTLAILKSHNAPVKAVAAGALYRPHIPTTGVYVAPGKRISGASGLVGKRVNVDFLNSPAHLGLLRWLDRSGVRQDQVTLSTLPFAQAVGPLLRGDFEAAVFPEPQATLALQGGARRIALPFDSVCSQDCLGTVYIARSNVDRDLAARFRNAVQAAAVWANLKRNQAASARILARYANAKPTLVAKMTRTSYATRLRPRMAQPWLDLYSEYGLLPASYPADNLVK